MTLHPHARTYLAELRPPEPGVGGIRDGLLQQARRWAGPAVECGTVRELAVGGVPCRLYHPAPGAVLPAIVHVHGGGWVAGDLDTHDATCRRLAAASGVAVLAVHYRRSPEHVFPAAIEDVEVVAAALRAGGEPSIDGSALALLGDSAGATVVAAVARRARDGGLSAYRLQVLVYPVIDPAMDTDSYRELATGFGLTAAAMASYWDSYGAPEGRDPDVCPAWADDLAGLPPALVLTAEFDPLHDEGEAYADALARAGVPVVATRYLGMIHGFWRMPGLFDAAVVAIEQVAGTVRARMFVS